MKFDLVCTDEKPRLLAMLRTRAYRAGTVTLSSGKTSDFYIDCKQVTLHAEGLYLCSALLLDTLRHEFPLAASVGGPTLGADPLVAGIAQLSFLTGASLNAYIIRKEPKGHGTGAYLEGLSALDAARPTVIIEDVVTTGKSGLTAVQRARDAGLNVQGVMCLVDRLEGGAGEMQRAGLKFVALFTRKDFLP